VYHRPIIFRKPAMLQEFADNGGNNTRRSQTAKLALIIWVGVTYAKHGPQPASMRAAPAFRERLCDFEAVNTGSFSSPGRQCVNGRSWNSRSGKRSAT
ncbi:hypothetical protein, partial [Klebsiella pneumoniae]|uniref:hypothetical protein n=1 Tax=Klebsiella pneumoniae TaxID=573 RepID=UPI003744CE06